jgi:hypothetical protein
MRTSRGARALCANDSHQMRQPARLYDLWLLEA